MKLMLLPVKTSAVSCLGHRGELHAIKPMPGSGSGNLWLVGNYNNGLSYPVCVLKFNGVSTWTLWDLYTTNNEGVCVAPLDSTHVWATGGTTVTGSNTTHGKVWQYDGTDWTLTLDDGAALFNGLEAFATNDVWYQGNDTSSAGGTGAIGGQWTGAAWTSVLPPRTGSAYNPTLREVYGGDGLSSTELWFCGTLNQYQWADRHTGTSTGSEWSTTRLGVLYALWARTTTDVYACGIENNGHPDRADLVRYNGTTWAAVTSPPSNSNYQSLFRGIHGTSASDIWCVGWKVPLSGNPDEALVEHWDGTTWVAHTIAAGQAGTFTHLYGVYANSTTDVWAVGYRSRLAPCADTWMFMIHYDGTSWTEVSVPQGAETVAETVYVSLVAVCTPSGAGSDWTITLTLVNSGSTTWDLDYNIFFNYESGDIALDFGPQTTTIAPGTTTIVETTGVLINDWSTYAESYATLTWIEGPQNVYWAGPICA